MKIHQYMNLKKNLTNPKSNLASMGVYIFDWKTLKEYFEEADNNGANYDDFGKNLIPKMLEDANTYVCISI